MNILERINLLGRLRKAERELKELRRQMARQIYTRPYVSMPIAEFARKYQRSDRPGFDYRGFEALFRDGEVTKKALKGYVQYFDGRRRVVDIGCGRGEFLELLREAGVEASGVDSDEGMIAAAREKALDVVQADFMDFLSGLEDASRGGIFSSQFIEHIDTERLDSFFKTAFAKLEDGGVIVCETVNPHHSAAFRFFYLDPTHVRPLFPEVTAFLAIAAGFSDPVIVYPNYAEDDARAYHECGEYALVAFKRAITGTRRRAGAPS